MQQGDAATHGSWPGLVFRLHLPARGPVALDWLAGALPAGVARPGSPRELLARVHPDDRSPLLELLRSSIRTGGHGRHGLRVQAGDGWLWLLCSWTCGPTGSGIEFVFHCVDQTPERHAYETQRAQLHHLHAVVANLPAAVCHLDRHGVFTFAGGAALAQLGLSADLMVGHAIFDLFPDQAELLQDVRNALAGALSTAVAQVGPLTFEYSCTPLLDEAHTARGATLILTDITGRARAQETLRRSEASFRALIEHSPDAVFVHRFGRLVYVNPTACALLGYGEQDALVGRPVLDLIAAPDRHAVAGLIRAAQDLEAPVVVEQSLLHRSGHVITLEVTTMRFPFAGEPALLAVGRDISERKRVHAKLLQAERLASIGALAAGMAHEINNPLAFVLANLVFLQEELRELRDGALSPAGASRSQVGRIDPGGIDTGRIDELLAAIGECRDGTERVEQIVKQLSAFARTDPHHLRTVNLGDVMDAAIRVAWPALRRSARVQVHYQCDALVDGNEAQLGQLFLNLLVNAAQAIAERQHGATAPELDRVSVVLQATDGGIEIAVSDTGTGIDPALVERIFEPFFSTRAPGQGTGLGLAVCASVVAAHGGTIQAASRPGQGCRFTLQLPAAAAGDTPARPATGREVLVVCGEPRTFRTLQETLRGHRMTYIGAESLALRLLRQQRYDVLVCDTVLSEAERARFLADVRSLQPELGGRTIVITPRGVPERNRPLQDPGNEGFRLERPVTAAALAQAMHQVLAPVLDRAPDGSVDRPRA